MVYGPGDLVDVPSHIILGAPLDPPIMQIDNLD